MRKSFNPIIAACALLPLTACVADDPAVSSAGDGVVKFTVSCPGSPESRALGDTPVADKLYYSVYGSDNSLLMTETIDGAFGNGAGSPQDVSIQLVPGQKYNILFFAESSDSKFGDEQYPSQTFTYNPQTGLLSFDKSSTRANDERDDVFYSLSAVTAGSQASHSVTLKRPLAQINIGTSDLSSPAVAQTDISKYSMEVTLRRTGFLKSLNLLTGKQSWSSTSGTSSTRWRDISFSADTTFPVEGYSNLASLYLLEPGDANTLIGGEIKIYYDVDPTAFNPQPINTISLENVPVRANYRTNIYGSLLTSANNFSVDISPAFDGDGIKYPVDSEGYFVANDVASFQQLLADPGVAKIKVAEGSNVDASSLPEGTRVMVDRDLLITNNGSIKLPANCVTVRSATLTLDGSGSWEAPMNLFTSEGAHIVVNSGSYTATVPNAYGGSTPVITDASYYDDANTYHGYEGVVTVNGGTITSEGYAAIYCNQTKALNINGGTIVSADKSNVKGYAVVTTQVDAIKITGGTIVGDWGGVRIASSNSQSNSHDVKSTLTMTGGTIIVRNSNGLNAQHGIVTDAEGGEGGSVVNVSGGYIYSNGVSCITLGGSPKGTMNITGGFYNKTNGITPAEGYEMKTLDTPATVSFGGVTYDLPYRVMK